MGAFTGARAASDGLLFCMDCGNPKSYTVSSTIRNLASGSEQFGDASMSSTGYVLHSDSIQITNSTTNLISASGYNFTNDPGITMEVVFKTAVADNHNTYGRIIDWRDTTMSLGTYSTEQFRCWVNAGGGRMSGEFFVNSSEPGFYDTWNHAVMTYNKSVVKGYWNNSERFSVAKTGNLENGTNQLTIGNGDSNYYGGKIAFVRIYNRGITADEVAANYTSLNHRYNFGN